MLNTTMNNSLPSQDSASSASPSEGGRSSEGSSLWARISSFLRVRAGKKTSDKASGEFTGGDASGEAGSAEHTLALLSNIHDMRDLTVDHVMIPRADVLALEIDTPPEDVLKFFSSVHVSRVPVYHESLDSFLGTVHIKDVLTALAEGREIILRDMLTDAPVVSPTMPLLDMLLEMRRHRRHMAIVADEYGGMDGLVTIGDVVEAMIGEIDDEHDLDDEPEMVDEKGGAILADARVEIEDFCARYGAVFSEDVTEDCDTLGGLVFYVAGRVPARGEVITHEGSGITFEIVDADQRRIRRVRIRGVNKEEAASLSYAAV